MATPPELIELINSLGENPSPLDWAKTKGILQLQLKNTAQTKRSYDYIEDTLRAFRFPPNGDSFTIKEIEDIAKVMPKKHAADISFHLKKHHLQLQKMGKSILIWLLTLNNSDEHIPFVISAIEALAENGPKMVTEDDMSPDDLKIILQSKGNRGAPLKNAKRALDEVLNALRVIPDAEPVPEVPAPVDKPQQPKGSEQSHQQATATPVSPPIPPVNRPTAPPQQSSARSLPIIDLTEISDDEPEPRQPRSMVPPPRQAKAEKTASEEPKAAEPPKSSTAIAKLEDPSQAEKNKQNDMSPTGVDDERPKTPLVHQGEITPSLPPLPLNTTAESSTIIADSALASAPLSSEPAALLTEMSAVTPSIIDTTPLPVVEDIQPNTVAQNEQDQACPLPLEISRVTSPLIDTTSLPVEDGQTKTAAQEELAQDSPLPEVPAPENIPPAPEPQPTTERSKRSSEDAELEDPSSAKKNRTEVSSTEDDADPSEALPVPEEKTNTGDDKPLIDSPPMHTMETAVDFSADQSVSSEKEDLSTKESSNDASSGFDTSSASAEVPKLPTALPEEKDQATSLPLEISDDVLSVADTTPLSDGAYQPASAQEEQDQASSLPEVPAPETIHSAIEKTQTSPDRPKRSVEDAALDNSGSTKKNKESDVSLALPVADSLSTEDLPFFRAKGAYQPDALSLDAPALPAFAAREIAALEEPQNFGELTFDFPSPVDLWGDYESDNAPIFAEQPHPDVDFQPHLSLDVPTPLPSVPPLKSAPAPSEVSQKPREQAKREDEELLKSREQRIQKHARMIVNYDKMGTIIESFRFTDKMIRFTEEEAVDIYLAMPTVSAEGINTELFKHRTKLQILDKSFLYWVLTFVSSTEQMPTVISYIIALAKYAQNIKDCKLGLADLQKAVVDQQKGCFNNAIALEEALKNALDKATASLPTALSQPPVVLAASTASRNPEVRVNPPVRSSANIAKVTKAPQNQSLSKFKTMAEIQELPKRKNTALERENALKILQPLYQFKCRKNERFTKEDIQALSEILPPDSAKNIVSAMFINQEALQKIDKSLLQWILVLHNTSMHLSGVPFAINGLANYGVPLIDECGYEPTLIKQLMIQGQMDGAYFFNVENLLKSVLLDTQKTMGQKVQQESMQQAQRPPNAQTFFGNKSTASSQTGKVPASSLPT